MSNFYLKFSVDGVMLKRIYCPSIVDGTNRFIHAKFEFGDGWGELTKYLFVARNNETYSVLMESDECIIDQHAVNTVGQFDMQVVGVKDDVRAVTNAITIKVKTSEMANNPSGEETRFTSDFIITSLEEIRKLKLDTEDIAKEYSEQAGAYAELAGDHEEAAKRIVDEMPGQINKAVEDATLAAEQFAEESKTSKDHSKQYADESKESADKAESSAVISKASEDTVKQISDELPQRINNYVANHKEELKGYTPIKGVDYFDGTNGRDGVDGKSVTVQATTDGALVSDEFGHSVLVKNGTDGKNGIDGKDGKDGINGEVTKAQLDEALAAQSDEIVQIAKENGIISLKKDYAKNDVIFDTSSVKSNDRVILYGVNATNPNGCGINLYDANGSYIAKISVNVPSGYHDKYEIIIPDSFSVAKVAYYPATIEKVVVYNETNKGIIENVNSKNVDVEELQDIVGTNTFVKFFEITTNNSSANTFSVDEELHAGDVLKVEYVGTKEALNQITVVTTYNGTNKDYFLRENSAKNIGESTITLTTDANGLKFYSLFGFTQYKVYKQKAIKDIQTDNLYETTVKLNTKIDNVKNDINKDFYSIGEAIVKNNIDFALNDFMKIVMIDCSYKFFSKNNIKIIIDKMQSVGLNYLEIGLGGSGHGWSFKFDDMKIVSDGIEYDLSNSIITNNGKFHTEADLLEIISYAKEKGIEIIPSIDMPGHMTALLKDRQQFWYKNSQSALNIDDEKAINFALAIANKFAKWFAENGSHFYNICADEFYNVESGYVDLHDNNNYAYADFINKLAFIVAKNRLVPLVWNDAICIRDTSVPFINRRLLVNFWLKRNTWDSPAKMQAEGYKMINSSSAIYWTANDDTSVTVDRMRAFDYKRYQNGDIIEDTIGAKFCVWIGTRETPSLNDDGNNITNTILPLVQAFGERLSEQGV